MARLLTPKEAATWMGISRSKVYEMLARDELPSIKIDRARRIPREGLEAWLDRQLAEQAQYAPGANPHRQRLEGGGHER